MYAVIETGGKQYRVEVGTELEVELIDASPGDSIKLERVLLVADGETAAIGRPIVENASVAGEIVRRDRGPKLINFKYGPKTRRRVKKGHRQELTILRISDIVLDGKSAAVEKAEADKLRKAERERLEETARKQAAADAALAAKLAADTKADAKAKADKADKTESKATTGRGSKGAAASKAGATSKTAAKTTTKPAAKAAPKSGAAAKAKSDTKPAATRRSTTNKDT
jgi:large subunit ribosomal protein L21